jgi:hypothetical protein
MIGTHPMPALGPLDYRYALDAAMSALAGAGAPAVRCNIPELVGEVRQRVPWQAENGAVAGALWVEPRAGDWQRELATIADRLRRGAPLVVVASRPLARLLPERRSWGGRPLGMRPGGVARLRRALPPAGFTPPVTYGIHPATAIGLSLLSRSAEIMGRPDLADRLHFAARLHYCAAGPLAALSTIVLLIARKDSGT